MNPTKYNKMKTLKYINYFSLVFILNMLNKKKLYISKCHRIACHEEQHFAHSIALLHTECFLWQIHENSISLQISRCYLFYQKLYVWNKTLVELETYK